MGSIVVREVTSSEDPALVPAYRLLAQAFGPEERVRLREWRGTLQERERELWSDVSWHLFIAERGRRVVGLTSGTYLGNVSVGVIGYLVIAPDARGSGLGPRLRNRLRAAFKQDALRITGAPLKGVLGEVSADNPWLASLSRRPNVLPLDVAYYQPRLHAGDMPSPFVLYLESLDRPRSRIPAAELRRLLYTIWRRVYRIARPLRNPAFQATMRSLRGRRTIGRWRGAGGTKRTAGAPR